MLILLDENLLNKKLKNLSRYSIQVIVLNIRTTQPSYLLPLMETICDRLSSLLVSPSFFFNDLGEIQQIY